MDAVTLVHPLGDVYTTYREFPYTWEGQPKSKRVVSYAGGCHEVWNGEPLSWVVEMMTQIGYTIHPEVIEFCHHVRKH